MSDLVTCFLVSVVGGGILVVTIWTAVMLLGSGMFLVCLASWLFGGEYTKKDMEGYLFMSCFTPIGLVAGSGVLTLLFWLMDIVEHIH